MNSRDCSLIGTSGQLRAQQPHEPIHLPACWYSNDKSFRNYKNSKQLAQICNDKCLKKCVQMMCYSKFNKSQQYTRLTYVMNSSRYSFAHNADRIPQAIFILVPGVHLTTMFKKTTIFLFSNTGTALSFTATRHISEMMP